MIDTERYQLAAKIALSHKSSNPNVVEHDFIAALLQRFSAEELNSVAWLLKKGWLIPEIITDLQDNTSEILAKYITAGGVIPQELEDELFIDEGTLHSNHHIQLIRVIGYAYVSLMNGRGTDNIFWLWDRLLELTETNPKAIGTVDDLVHEMLADKNFDLDYEIERIKEPYIGDYTERASLLMMVYGSFLGYDLYFCEKIFNYLDEDCIYDIPPMLEYFDVELLSRLLWNSTCHSTLITYYLKICVKLGIQPKSNHPNALGHFRDRSMSYAAMDIFYLTGGKFVADSANPYRQFLEVYSNLVLYDNESDTDYRWYRVWDLAVAEACHYAGTDIMQMKYIDAPSKKNIALKTLICIALGYPLDVTIAYFELHSRNNYEYDMNYENALNSIIYEQDNEKVEDILNNLVCCNLSAFNNDFFDLEPLTLKYAN